MTDPRWAESRAPLVERLRDRIQAAGPLTFADFMAAALYDPEEGYYVRRADRASRSGDFLSAPEQDPLFGALLARQVADCWERLGQPAQLHLREDGAGSGALAQTLLEALRATSPGAFAAVRYAAREADPQRGTAIAARLAAAGLGATIGEESAPLDPGLVIANELLDALPVHRLVLRDGELLELLVDWAEDWFVERPGPLSEPRLAAQLAAEDIVLADGQRTEVCLAALDWVARLGRDLRRGYALIVDYGHPAARRHDAARPEGLLRTYRAHHAGDDPFQAVGEQDLTAHVDWTAVEAAAGASGLGVAGRVPLPAFALGLDAGSLLTELGGRQEMSADRYRSARAALRDLLDPRRLGRFEVLVLARDAPLDPPLRGLGASLPAGFGQAGGQAGAGGLGGLGGPDRAGGPPDPPQA
ncbi:MAG TPA: SAM-dependent methyltransferase [Candidatus Limnocylindrales bacterium]|nr:SAM-dependent methyltransferase [Candidatus Limnocylindrales bacterium]